RGSPGQCHHPGGPGRGQDLLVPVDDPATRQVVRRQLHHDPVVREDADVVHAHLAADVCQDLVAVLELDLEHGVRKRLDDSALDLDGTLLLGHASPFESTTLINSDVHRSGSERMWTCGCTRADESVYVRAVRNTNRRSLPRWGDP